jgi:hypothetical protein
MASWWHSFPSLLILICFPSSILENCSTFQMLVNIQVYQEGNPKSFNGSCEVHLPSTVGQLIRTVRETLRLPSDQQVSVLLNGLELTESTNLEERGVWTAAVHANAGAWLPSFKITASAIKWERYVARYTHSYCYLHPR